MPVFEQIEELKTDSVEIKKFIRKVNYDMIGYNCNHDIYQMPCSRCDAARRKYQYSLFQINRMREELKEQQEIDQQYMETPDENKYDMKWFLQKNYPTIDRFLLKDVQTKYKATFKINLTFDELKKRIEETGLFTISNVYRTMYVNRVNSKKYIEGYLYIAQLKKHQGTNIYKVGRTKNIKIRLKSYNYTEGGADVIKCLFVNNQYLAEDKLLKSLYKAVENGEIEKYSKGVEYFEGPYDVILNYYNQVILEFQ